MISSTSTEGSSEDAEQKGVEAAKVGLCWGDFDLLSAFMVDQQVEASGLYHSAMEEQEITPDNNAMGQMMKF